MKIDWKGIAEGVRNNLFPPEQLKGFLNELSAERMSICDACPEEKVTAVGKYCRICGCNLQLKTKAPSAQCPINKWLAVTSKEISDEIKHKAHGNS